MNRISKLLVFLVLIAFTGCMEWDYGKMEDFSATGEGLFITNEGNFQYGNATLSYYDPETKTVENEIFYRANAMKLGDVAQSMTIRNGVGWVVVNNSHVIYAININTFKEVGRITGLTSPRYIHFLSDEKAYVTQIWDNRIFIVNPKTYQITGYIDCPDMTTESGSTEQMVQYGKYVFVNCWSYQNRILIDAETFQVEKQFKFKLGDWPSEVQLNREGDMLYWINKDIWQMSVDADRVPVRPFLKYSNTIYYGLTVDPKNGDVYVADAIDYQQDGIVYRYTKEGKLIDQFYVGIIPGAFCWK